MSKHFSNHDLVQDDDDFLPDDFFDSLSEDQKRALQAEMSVALGLDAPFTDDDLNDLFKIFGGDDLRHDVPVIGRHMYFSD